MEVIDREGINQLDVMKQWFSRLLYLVTREASKKYGFPAGGLAFYLTTEWPLCLGTLFSMFVHTTFIPFPICEMGTLKPFLDYPLQQGQFADTDCT